MTKFIFLLIYLLKVKKLITLLNLHLPLWYLITMVSYHAKVYPQLFSLLNIAIHPSYYPLYMEKPRLGHKNCEKYMLLTWNHMLSKYKHKDEVMIMQALCQAISIVAKARWEMTKIMEHLWMLITLLYRRLAKCNNNSNNIIIIINIIILLINNNMRKFYSKME